MPYCSIYQIKARQYNYYIWLWWYTQSNSRDLPYYIALRKYTVCMPMYVHYMYYCIYPTLKKELGNLIAKFCNNKSDSWDLLYSIYCFTWKSYKYFLGMQGISDIDIDYRPELLIF